MAKKSTSPWVYVGCGCVALVAFVLLGIGAMGFAGFRFAKNLEEEFKDPRKRQESALAILGSETLPEGFHAQMNLRIPMLLEMVMLSDGPVSEYDEERRQVDLSSETLGDKAFIFMALADMGTTRRDIERLMEGKTGGLNNVQFDLDFRSSQILGRGEFEISPQKLRYVAHRGEFGDDHDTPEGTYAVMMIECPGSSKVRSSKVRSAFYWQRYGGGAEEVEGGDDVDLAGTPYEENLRAFMGHFNVCSK